MEWLPTLVWLLRGNKWGWVFMVTWVAVVYGYVPKLSPKAGGGIAAVELDKVR